MTDEHDYTPTEGSELNLKTAVNDADVLNPPPEEGQDESGANNMNTTVDEEEEEGQYVSTSVPVPPVTNTMALHSPIVIHQSLAPPGDDDESSSPLLAAAAAAPLPPSLPNNSNDSMPPPLYANNSHHQQQQLLLGEDVSTISNNIDNNPTHYLNPDGAIHRQLLHQTTNTSTSNSNFWLQDEEERFLLGLRLYGWGQWKRIQSVVQTRTNKQIKSHAQKREKVNPQIKVKYAKGKAKRGRIASRDAILPGRGVLIHNPEEQGDGGHSFDEMWTDVYGTNNGVGPNSRLRRCRNSVLHQQWLDTVQNNPPIVHEVGRKREQHIENDHGVDTSSSSNNSKQQPIGKQMQPIKASHIPLPPPSAASSYQIAPVVSVPPPVRHSQRQGGGSSSSHPPMQFYNSHMGMYHAPPPGYGQPNMPYGYYPPPYHYGPPPPGKWMLLANVI